MKKLDTKGFSPLHILLLLVIVGMIGSVGYYVYSSQKENKKPSAEYIALLEKTKNEQNAKDKQKILETNESKGTIYALETRLTSLNKKFSLNVPNGWIFTNDTEQDYTYSTSMTYKKDEVAKVNNEFGHRGGGFTKTSFVIQYAKDGLKGYYSASKTDGTLKLNNGRELKKYFYVIGTADEMGIAGSKSYGYQVDYEDGTIVLTYLVNPTDTDQRELVEASIKTLNF